MAATPDPWTRRYPPLLGALVATVLAVLVLPSALNVPQSNPAQTLEFAPIPPQDDDVPPPDAGNTASLGLGSSDTALGDALGGGPGSPPDLPPPALPEGAGARPVTKRCVGSPPRQTEDPLAPPCVAHFEGDNGGATYQGVTGDEITVLFYLDVNCEITSAGVQCPEPGYVDLASTPQPDEPLDTRALRAFQRYFNSRYQTYGRTVHLWIHYPQDVGREADTEGESPERRRADALDNVGHVDPFAVLPYGTFVDSYIETTAAQGVLNFGSLLGREADFYQQHPGRIWSFLPSIEKTAALFADFVCTKVVPHPVSFSGNADHGKPRTLGLLRTSDPQWPGIIRFGEVAAGLIEGCGGSFAEEGTYPHNADATDPGATDNEIPATSNVAAFEQADVTTVIWPQGFETSHSRAADRIGYYPEWITAGDGQTDGYQPQQFQNQQAWDDHNWVVTTRPLEAAASQCELAAGEGDPTFPEFDRGQVCTFRTYYDDLRLLFTGVQVAGPRLTVETLDRGFHAIPAVRSDSPYVPACYFDPGDYTCIKDGAAAWWDFDAEGPGGYYPNGCYRYGNDGQRSFPGTWPEGDVLSMKQPDNVCSAYAGPANR
ncbi:MAG TPA: hypothetical protein VGA69_10255 [Nitriliruptorales bacterium]